VFTLPIRTEFLGPTVPRYFGVWRHYSPSFLSLSLSLSIYIYIYIEYFIYIYFFFLSNITISNDLIIQGIVQIGKSFVGVNFPFKISLILLLSVSYRS